MINNPQRHRFETNVDGLVAVLNYNKEGKSITFIYTEFPDELAGRGDRALRSGLPTRFRTSFVELSRDSSLRNL
jgi:predicted GNAT family acetyltransferase